MTLSRLWRHGTAADVAGLEAAVQTTVEGIVRITGLLGLSAVFPKSHELRHIVFDFAYFGAACFTSTGELSIIVCDTVGVLGSDFVACMSVTAETFETKHKELKKLYLVMSPQDKFHVSSTMLRRVLTVEISRFAVPCLSLLL